MGFPRGPCADSERYMFSFAFDILFAGLLDPVRFTASITAKVYRSYSKLQQPQRITMSASRGEHPYFRLLSIDPPYSVIPYTLSVSRHLVAGGLREVVGLKPGYHA